MLDPNGPDPFAWLEDLDAPAVQAWAAERDREAMAALRALPGRGWLTSRLQRLFSYERYGVPRQRGGRSFFTWTDGSHEQAGLYVANTLRDEPRLLVDPEQLVEQGAPEPVTLVDFVVSDDGRRVAYGVSRGGSDWTTWRIRDVETGRDLDDTLQWIKFSKPSWLPDGSGLYYARYRPAARGSDRTRHHAVYFHRLGTPQRDDLLVLERPEQPDWSFTPSVTRRGRSLVLTVRRATEPRTALWVAQLGEEPLRWQSLGADFLGEHQLVGSEGDRFWIRTTAWAPRGRIVEVTVGPTGAGAWREVLPEAPDPIANATRVAGRLVVLYLRDARHRVAVYGADGRPEGEVPLPGPGTVSGLVGGRSEPAVYFVFSSVNRTPCLYRYDLERRRLERLSPEPQAFEPDAYVTRQLFAESTGGVRVPMFVSRHRDVTGPAPAMVVAYGGFGTSMTPAFSPTAIAWMDLGGAYVVVNARGGGEYGAAWQRSGAGLHKQNTFDDVFAAVDALVAANIAIPGRVALSGASNGGLTVGACLTQRPELFGAALAEVGVFDMLRFHRYTIGPRWIGEYGSPEDPQVAAVLLRYSPYHNVARRAYPPTLLITARGDDRVVPIHSYKMAAALAEAQRGDGPVLLRVLGGTGHGRSRPLSGRVEGAVERLAFLAWALGLEVPEEPPPSGAGAFEEADQLEDVDEVEGVGGTGEVDAIEGAGGVDEVEGSGAADDVERGGGAVEVEEVDVLDAVDGADGADGVDGIDEGDVVSPAGDVAAPRSPR